MSPPSHVFVVGSGRSGTTLMVRILNASEELAICGETRFLTKGPYRPGFRRTFSRIGDIATEPGARRVVDYIYHGIQEWSHWDWIRLHVDQEQFLHSFLESDRTDRALFDLVMAFYAGGKPVRGEKTPAHIYYVPTLLEWFPHAKVIHILRDPRAIFVSKKLRIAGKEWDALHYRLVRGTDLTLNLYLGYAVVNSWLGCVRRHHQYQKAYPQRYYLLRFEDLIADPRASLTRLCDFLDVSFSEVMLRQRVVNSSFGSPDSWAEGFDASANERWRSHMSRAVHRWFVARCKRRLLEFGYQF
ncbi:sulfotransferase [Chloroflexota bacterium]